MPTKKHSLQYNALKKHTKLEMLEVIFSCLDCPGHFYKPVIKGATFKKHKDEDFSYGDHPIVLCSQCVDRLRSIIGLNPGEPVPSPFDFEGWKSISSSKKRSSK